MKSMYFLACFAFLAVTIPFSGAAETIHQKSPEIFYGSVIDAAVALCEAKKSSSTALSDKAQAIIQVACQKGNFLKKHRSELITHLAKMNVRNNIYIVNYHLNNWFYTYQEQGTGFLANR